MQQKKSLVFLLLILTFTFSTAPVLADDTSGSGKPITLTINWMDDKPSDRPELLTIELIRTLDGVVYPMDSKPLTAQDAISTNTWKTTFAYYYGEVWEYSFKITKVEPETALYSYQLIESGNGTDEYTFDYIYGQGETEMTIITHWENVEESQRPASLTVDLYSFNDQNHSERQLLLTGQGDSWSASVAGLKDNPDNYFIVLSDLPGNFTNVVSKGDSPNIYINTITPNYSTAGEDQNSLSENVSGMVNAVSPQRPGILTILGSVGLGVILTALVGGGILLVIFKLRKSKRKDEKHND